MSQLDEYVTALKGLTDGELREYLRAHSGLPGPRANLTLADAFAACAPPDQVLALSAESDEYLAFCGTEGLGPLALDPQRRSAMISALLAASTDARWRVREAVARGLQLIGDQAPGLLRDVVDRWSRSDDPYVLRAAIAAMCEPRLLASPAGQGMALAACDRATTWLLRADPAASPEARKTLRKSLGYCWSVAVAASPEAGLRAFGTLAADPSRDARWIVASNLKKARMQRVLQSRGLTAADLSGSA